MDAADLVRRVSRHFFDLVDDEANPLVVALALQDNSSVGLQHYSGEFEQLYEELRTALKSKVDESYQGFNESVGVYRQVVTALKTGHEDVRNAREQLVSMKGQLAQRKSKLKELHQKSMRFKRKLEILDDLEKLQQLPPKHEESVARKQFGEAHNLLSEALEIINVHDLVKQPSIKPLLQFVQTQRVQLVSKIVEDMRNHIYLESPYALKRLELDNTDFQDFINGLPELPKDQAQNPETNSFSYLTGLLKTQAGLQSLGSTLEELVKTVDHDLRRLVQKTTANVVSDLKLTPNSLRKAAQGQTLLEQFHSIDQTPLETLAKALYTRLVAVLEAHRAIYEISKEYGLDYDLDAICDAIVRETRTFLLSYIGGSETGPLLRMRPRAASDNFSRVSRSKHAGPIFEFGPTDEDSRGLRDFEVLRESLKRSVPGLLTDDPHHLFAETQQRTQLEVVAPAHILNIRPLVEPSASFFSKAQDIVVSKKSREQLDTFLNQFLQRSFVPRLQRAFDEAIDAISTDDTALDEISDWSKLSQLPITNSVWQYAETIGLLSQLLDNGSGYRDEYAVILVGLISTITRFFTQRISDLFAVGNTGDKHPTKAWEMAVSSPLESILGQRFSQDRESNLRNSEFSVYYGKRQTPQASKAPLSIADLLDIGVYKQASLLITSVRWFVLRLRKMRKVATHEISQENNASSSVRMWRRWSALDDPATDNMGINHAVAVLSGHSLSEYDRLIAKLSAVVFKALGALRVDTFLRTTYYFDQMITNHEFHNSKHREERDPVVDRLQRDFSLVSQVTDEHLIPTDREFLIDGIAQYMNELFILEGENIDDMNDAGQGQMLTNIFALQQMLTSIVPDPRDVDFSRATWFYELFRLTPALILERVKGGETDLSLADLELLLRIRHRNAANSSASSLAFGTLSVHLSQVREMYNGSARGTHLSNEVMGSGSSTSKQQQSQQNTDKSEKEPSKRPSQARVTPQADKRLHGGPVANKDVQQKSLAVGTRAHGPNEAEKLRFEREELKAGGSQGRHEQAQTAVKSTQQGQDSLKSSKEARDREIQEIGRRRELERQEAAQKERAMRENAEKAENERRGKARRVRIEKEREKQERMRQEHRRAEEAEAQRERTELEQARRDRAQREQDQQERANQERVRRDQAQQQAQAQRQAQIQAQQPSQQQQASQANVVVQAPTSAGGARTAAAPTPGAAKSPLLNHRPRFESVPQKAAGQDADSAAPAPQPPPHTQRPLPKVRVDVQAANSGGPTSPSSESRPRTPSERALEAAGKVRPRPMPQPQVRRPSQPRGA